MSKKSEVINHIELKKIMNKITKDFPKSYTPKDMEEIIIDLLGNGQGICDLIILPIENPLISVMIMLELNQCNIQEINYLEISQYF